jgi:tripartite-type tricarboxylate transporter receptor subunit TctC
LPRDYVVVAYPAGSAADAMTRVLVARMAVTLSQPLIIDTRPVANANLGIVPSGSRK